MATKKEIYILLHNIRSTHNVGSIFRTADAAGVTKIFISGYTPTPIDKFGKARSDIAKTALGAELTIPWEYGRSPTSAILKMKRNGVQLVAIEQAAHSIDYKKVKVRYPVLFLVGNEVKGLSPALIKKCDIVAEIPMKGEKESLNASVSFGIALFRMLNN
jgi:23S rRNA (guanosine2251-2'-O)-methyltransferase